MHRKYPHICLLSLVLGAALPVFAQDVNKLSAAEASAGYDLLFNGTNLSDWHAYRVTGRVPDVWTVKTNAPLGVRIENIGGVAEPILTNKKYTNFDLKVDVMTTQNGNSGIFTRYEEVATFHGNARSGPEFQVCGPSHSDCTGTTKHFGSCYDMFGVKESLRSTWYNPPGQWNQIRIIAFDSNYVHYGNGKKLLEYKIGTQAFITAYNASKYASDGNNGRYYHIHPGSFLLQHHGETGISFRNIKAKELTVHPFKKDFLNGQWPDTLSQSAVLGLDPVSTLKENKQANLIWSIAGPGLLQVRVPAVHGELHAVGIDGRPIAIQKTSDGEYTIRSSGQAAGLVILRLRSEGKTLTQIVRLP